MPTALTAYRHLLRAARVAFGGDAPVLGAAQQKIRNEFRDKASLPPSDPAVVPAIKHAEEVAQFLTSNVVQGQKEGDVWRLRIHDGTERGDNDTVKLAKGGTVKVGGQGCCSA